MRRVAMGLVVLGLAGCGGGKPTDAPERPAQEVGVLTLRPEAVEVVVELPGRTSSYRMAEVRPQVSGIILKRLFTEGEQVKAGEQRKFFPPLRRRRGRRTLGEFRRQSQRVPPEPIRGRTHALEPLTETDQPFAAAGQPFAAADQPFAAAGRREQPSRAGHFSTSIRQSPGSSQPTRSPVAIARQFASRTG